MHMSYDMEMQGWCAISLLSSKAQCDDHHAPLSTLSCDQETVPCETQS